MEQQLEINKFCTFVVKSAFEKCPTDTAHSKCEYFALMAHIFTICGQIYKNELFHIKELIFI